MLRCGLADPVKVDVLGSPEVILRGENQRIQTVLSISVSGQFPADPRLRGITSCTLLVNGDVSFGGGGQGGTSRTIPLGEARMLIDFPAEAQSSGDDVVSDAPA
jgi:hypothetical protein